MRRIANEILGVKGSIMKLSCRVRSLETKLLSCGCFSFLLLLLKLITKKKVGKVSVPWFCQEPVIIYCLGKRRGGSGLCVGEYLISPKDSVIFLCSLLYSPPLKFCWRLLIPPPFPLETMWSPEILRTPPTPPLWVMNKDWSLRVVDGLREKKKKHFSQRSIVYPHLLNYYNVICWISS